MLMHESTQYYVLMHETTYQTTPMYLLLFICIGNPFLFFISFSSSHREKRRCQAEYVCVYVRAGGSFSQVVKKIPSPLQNVAGVLSTFCQK
jgi:hypothetical protein